MTSNWIAERPQVDPGSLSRAVSQAADLQLLRRYEPVLAFTEGEMFFPMRVDGYLKDCSLMYRGDRATAQTVIERGVLTPDMLVAKAGESNRLLALRFVDKPLSGLDYQHWRSHRPPFSAKGRHARVGLLGRLADALFRSTFLVRGSVPGGTTAGAQQQYAAIQADGPEYAYHGRVYRRDGYTVLNYLFFYAMNDWRSSFNGVNDHESDWEQIFVYLSESKDGGLEPSWVAYASHDFYGADLRRRWDDPELSRHGDHPVVFTGAGSHASYFLPGEYVINVQLAVLKPLFGGIEALRRFWRNTLRQGDADDVAQGLQESLSVPFVDYARGDGLRVGPGEAQEWMPVVIDDSVGWVNDYRGLWGIDTRDVLAGEEAPAGPKYQRDGSIRASWADPIGWCGLDQEAPPGEAADKLEERIQALEQDAQEVAGRAASIRAALPPSALEYRAIDGVSSLRRFREGQRRELEQLESDLRLATTEEAELRSAAGECRRLQERLRQGYRPGPQDHIRHHQVPESPQSFNEGRIAELWAAVSVGLLLILGAGLVLLGVSLVVAPLLLLASAVFVDSVLRGTVIPLLLNTTIFLAVLTVAVVAYQFFWWIALALMAIAGLLLLARNLRELRGH